MATVVAVEGIIATKDVVESKAKEIDCTEIAIDNPKVTGRDAIFIEDGTTTNGGKYSYGVLTYISPDY